MAAPRGKQIDSHRCRLLVTSVDVRRRECHSSTALKVVGLLNRRSLICAVSAAPMSLLVFFLLTLTNTL